MLRFELSKACLVFFHCHKGKQKVDGYDEGRLATNLQRQLNQGCPDC